MKRHYVENVQGKKLLSVVLSAVLAFSSVPTAAIADDVDDIAPGEDALVSVQEPEETPEVIQGEGAQEAAILRFAEDIPEEAHAIYEQGAVAEKLSVSVTCDGDAEVCYQWYVSSDEEELTAFLKDYGKETTEPYEHVTTIAREDGGQSHEIIPDTREEGTFYYVVVAMASADAANNFVISRIAQVNVQAGAPLDATTEDEGQASGEGNTAEQLQGASEQVEPQGEGEALSAGELVSSAVENIMSIPSVVPTSFLLYTGTASKVSHALVQDEGGSYAADVVFDPQTTAYELNAYGSSKLYSKIAVEDAQVIAKYGEGQSSTITWKSDNGKGIALPGYGKQALSIELVPNDTQTQLQSTYEFTVNVYATVTALSLKVDGAAAYFDKTFSASTFDYTVDVLADATTMDIDAVALSGSGAQLLFDGQESSSVSLAGKDAIVVSAVVGSGDNALSTDYTIHLNRITGTELRFDTSPSDAIVTVHDASGIAVPATEPGVYSALFSQGGYTYTVTRYGYVAQTGEAPTTGGTLTVSLVEAAESGIEETSAAWENFRNSDTNMAITDVETPRSADEASLLWSAKLGTGWSLAPSVQIIVDDSLIVLAGKAIYKLDLTTGEVLQQGDLVGATNFGYTPPTYAEGMIFCPLENGTIQAINATTLESVWVYHDSRKGQSLTPITYANGYIYTGFWCGTNKLANYVCLSVTDEDPTQGTEEKIATWKVTGSSGYYWAGSVVVGDAVIFGSDAVNDTSKVCSFNRFTGELISSIDLTNLGNQRSSMAYDTESGRVFFTVSTDSNGWLCSLAVNPTTGELSDFKSSSIGAKSTSTPVVYKGYVYFGSGKMWEGGSGGAFEIANASTLESVKSVDMLGYPQCSMLLSTAFEAVEDMLYFYSTYNSEPGGISLIKVKASDPTQTELVELYDADGFSQYCITSIICTEDGTLYYKNDSGNVLAVGFSSATSVKKLIDGIGHIDTQSGSAISTARSAYDKLSDEGKVQVDATPLEAAEATYASLMERVGAAASTLATTDGGGAADVKLTGSVAVVKADNTTVAVPGDSGVELRVAAGDPTSSGYQKLANEVAKFTGSTLLGVYDVNLMVEGSAVSKNFGQYSIEFPVDSQYNGRSIRVHSLNEGGNVVQNAVITVENDRAVLTGVTTTTEFALELMPSGSSPTDPTGGSGGSAARAAGGRTVSLGLDGTVATAAVSSGEVSGTAKFELSSNEMPVSVVGAQAEDGFPWLWVIVAAAAVLVLVFAMRLKDDDDEEKEYE